jgi:hypothetical protein
MKPAEKSALWLNSEQKSSYLLSLVIAKFLRADGGVSVG